MSNLTQYYTCADTNLFLEGPQGVIKLDTLKAVGYSEKYSAGPIYGTGNEVFGFTNRGNLGISGFIILHFTDNEYMKEAIKYVLKGETTQNYSQSTKKNIKKLFYMMADEQILTLKQQIADGDRELSSAVSQVSGISSFGSGFKIRLVFNNGNMVTGDINKTLIFNSVRILGSSLVSASGNDQPLEMRYEFVAQTLV